MSGNQPVSQLEQEVALVNYNTTTAEEIESDILNPVVFSADNSFCRFELEPKGFLSPDSAISIGLTPNADVLRATFPAGVGVYSLIKRAVLKTSSGRVINDTDQLGEQMGLKAMWLSNDINKQREQYSTGRILNYNFLTDSKGNKATSYALDNGKEYDSGTAGTGLHAHNFQVISNARTDLSPTFVVNLAELFPFLKARNRIPLFMLGNDRLQIELFFSTTTDARVCLSSGDDAHTGKPFLINQNDVQLIADHIFIPGGMDAWREAHKDEDYGYTEMVVSKHQVTTTTATNNRRNIGGAGRQALRVYAGVVCDVTDKDDVVANKVKGDLSILNKYVSESNMRNEDIHVELTSNLFYNERFLFPQSITNSARQYHNLKDASSKIVYCTRSTYADEGGIDSGVAVNDALFPVNTAIYQYEGRVQREHLAGKQFYQGFRLNRGERVGSKGIELIMNYADLRETATKVGNYTQYSMIEVLKRAVIVNGQLEVMYT